MRRYKLSSGKIVTVREENLEWFKGKYPNAIEIDESGTRVFREKDTLLERTFGKNVVTDYIGDIYRAGEQGLAQGATVDEAFDVYKKGANISDEELEKYIAVAKNLENKGASEEMQKYQKILEEEGGGVWGFMKAMAMTRGQIIPQVIVSSLVAMARTAVDSEEAAAITAATSAAGAGVGAGIGAAATSWTGPLAAIGSAIGAGTGALGGAIAGVSGSMETALTLTELMKKELKGKEFNKENIRKLLEDKETFDKIKGKALGRGITIGAIEGITAGVSRGVAGKMLQAGRGKAAIAAATTGIEATGGATGEALGQVAAGQEFDIAEVLLEGVAETKGLIGVADILATKTYKVNGKEATRKEVNDIITNKNIEASDLAQMKIEVIGDKNFDNVVKQKQADAVLESQIDPRIEAQDRKALVELENQRAKAEVDTKKKGIFTVPRADEKLQSIETQIEEITSKYEGVEMTPDAIERLVKGVEVRADVAERQFQSGLEFAKKHSKLYGLTYNDQMTQEEIKNQFGEAASKSNGFVDPETSQLIVNTEVARTKGIEGGNVANHELLHGIIKASGVEIKKSTIDNFLNLIGKDNAAVIQKRIDDNKETYTDEYLAATPDEYFTIFSDAIETGDIKFNDTIFTKIADVIRRMFADLGFSNVNFDDAKSVYNFLKDYNRSIHKGSLSAGIKKATKGVAKGDRAMSVSPEGKSIYDDTSIFTPENLVQIIKSPSSTSVQVAEAQKSLTNQFDLLALKALKYDTRKGDIARENVLSAAREYLPGIIDRFNPETSKFSTFVNSNIAPKQEVVYESAKGLTYGDTVSIDTKEARQVAAEPTETAKTPDTRKPKINILQDFAITDRVANKIKALVKVAENDTFKEVISKYAGKVGSLIFDIPAKKIMEGGSNLVPTRKYKEGMPIPSEAQNIQRFFQSGENMSKFIKSLPLYNVADISADIDKIGENIQTPRNVFGVAIGLKGLPLDYFYENYTDPRALSEDPNVRAESITSPAGRSKGVTTQPQVKRLKAEFRNPTPEVIEKAKTDIGITPRNEPNIYNRDIGQLLKGFSKVYSINASLSGAQRFLADKLAKAPVEKKPAIKKQIASVTAAQSKLAFSTTVENAVNDLFTEGITNPNFNLDLAGQNKMNTLLAGKKVNPTLNLKEDILTKKGRKKIVDHYKWIMANLGPKEMWFGKNGTGAPIFTKSNKDYGVSMSEFKKVKTEDGKTILVKNPNYSKKKANAFNKLKQDLIDIRNDKSYTDYGNAIKDNNGNVITDYAVSSYSSLLGNPEKAKSKVKDGSIKDFNNKVSAIHKAMWSRIYNLVGKDKNNASIIGTYLKLVANDTGHWHKLGAEIVGWSKKPKGLRGTMYEYEHAMPATAAYLYLMDVALNQANFSPAYKAVTDNYKLIALDKAENAKLGKAKLGRSMPKNWKLGENYWWQRYFNDVVAQFGGGINPNSIVDLNGETFAKKFNINNSKGINVAAKAKKANTLGRALSMSRKPKKPTKGISIWDFDDTLARTKSGVRYTMPNPDGTPKPRRKVIFLAGGPGSGKSTVVKNLGLEEQGFKIVNQDISLQWLMKNHGLPTDMRDFTREQMSKFGSLGWEARTIAQRKKAKFKGRGDGVIVDGTGASFRSMEAQRMEFLRNGYDVHMVFVETSLETALERNKARKERSLKDSIVERTWKSVMKNKSRFQQSQIFGDNFTLINTDKLKPGDNIPTKEVNKINDFTSGYIKERLTAEEFAEQGADILAQGGKFDFSEFDVVTEGSTGPLFAKAMNRAKKYGTKNQFILTARPVASAPHIQQFLESQGLNIPIENVAALENSTPEAKALWVADKIGEGYNDIYFADDALQNVQAVQNMVNQFDVKSDIQQAKLNFSMSMSDEFNKVLEDISGIDASKRFSDVKARKRGAGKGKFRFFIPPSHEDFVGLLYNFLGRGKKGNQHREFFEKALIRPLNTANREFDTARQSIANDFKTLNKSIPEVKKKLTKKTPDGDFTFEDAIRVYLWDKHGHDIPGLTKTDRQGLVDIVNADPTLKAYAENLNTISKRKDYVSPSKDWEAGNIRTDLTDATGRVGRAEYFTEFLENSKEIFSPENLNKVEAIYGKGVKEALQDILYRIETGRNRPAGQNALVNKFTNFINGAVGSVMFFNIRSAVLQQMSMVNYLNFADNNVFAAAKAFANQKQYWADWAYIFNSDMLKQRRGGIQTDVNGAELAKAVKDSRNPISAVVRKLLEYGFKPTQIGDNIAIATGGATYLRNRINTYTKQGLSKKEAEAKAFDDFQAITQSTQQSARPDMVSQQQASPLGKFILAFQNVTSQFNRLGKKAFLDLKNRRISPEYKNAKVPQLQSDMSNVSRIMYYLAVQNLVFYSLQTALFAMMFDEDPDDEKFLKKRERMINGSIDSVLRGTGVMGAVISTMKNMAIKWHEQRDKKYNADESAVMMEMLNVSPPIGIKARQIVNAEKTLNYNKKVIEEMETFDIDNPVWSAVTSYTEAVTNIPVNRLYKKTLNVRASLDNQYEAWARVLMFMGWSPWNLGIENKQVEGVKEDIKKRKKKEDKKKRKKTKTKSKLKLI